MSNLIISKLVCNHRSPNQLRTAHVIELENVDGRKNQPRTHAIGAETPTSWSAMLTHGGGFQAVLSRIADPASEDLGQPKPRAEA
jgi:hypothetical protein